MKSKAFSNKIICLFWKWYSKFWCGSAYGFRLLVFVANQWCGAATMKSFATDLACNDTLYQIQTPLTKSTIRNRNRNLKCWHYNCKCRFDATSNLLPFDSLILLYMCSMCFLSSVIIFDRLFNSVCPHNDSIY